MPETLLTMNFNSKVYGGNADAAVQTGAQFGISDPSLLV